jgi:hypothetical protein
VIEKVSVNRYVVNNYQGVRVVDARRQKKGFPWVVSKLQWRGANGDGEVAGFAGGWLEVATIEARSSQDAQLKMVMALLGALSEDVGDCRCLTCRRKRKAGGLVNA